MTVFVESAGRLPKMGRRDPSGDAQPAKNAGIISMTAVITSLARSRVVAMCIASSDFNRKSLTVHPRPGPSIGVGRDERKGRRDPHESLDVERAARRGTSRPTGLSVNWP